MVNDIRIILVIVMYMTGCFSLMAYNVIIIICKRSSEKAMFINTNKWISEITRELTYRSDITTLSLKHEKRLLKNLKRTRKLIAFSNALNHFRDEGKESLYDVYVSLIVQSGVFHKLAIVYRKKKNEERAYFAYFISQYPQLAENTEGRRTDIVNMMVSYIEDSDIYCRANVLKALCKIGGIHGIVNILQQFSDKHNFIHHRMLAEDLLSFAGDKEVLALYLWGKRRAYNDNVLLGIITFITMFSDGFKDVFVSVLNSKSISADIRIAVIRYFKEYVFEPAERILIGYTKQTDDYVLAAEAASALSAYPGYNTIRALVYASRSGNWDVQYSAVSSLVMLGEHPEDFVVNLAHECKKSRSDFLRQPFCTTAKRHELNDDELQITQHVLAHIYDETNMNASEVTI